MNTYNPNDKRNWYFEIEDWEDGASEYPDENGVNAGYDTARDTPFIGNETEANAEAERRADLWESQVNGFASKVTLHAFGRVNEAKQYE